MLSEAKRPATALRRRTLFLEAAEIIDEEYGFPVALDDVARRVATSRRQLQRAFAEAGEMSFRSYLQKVRMERAADLLRDPRTPVHVVASNVGYRQAAQFAKAFRRHHGAAPSSFRAEISARSTHAGAPRGVAAEPPLPAAAEALGPPSRTPLAA
jgi:AraC family transcriptional regulator, regulatory protein of adaptative response / methylphosphotriester-DNA alkyltransferase methyltransferase